MDQLEIEKKLEELHKMQLEVHGNRFQGLMDVLNEIRFSMDAVGEKLYGTASAYYEAKRNAKT